MLKDEIEIEKKNSEKKAKHYWNEWNVWSWDNPIKNKLWTLILNKSNGEK